MIWIYARTMGDIRSAVVKLMLFPVALLMVIVSGYTAVNAAVKSELYPAYIRALGVALPYAMASAIFGGTAENAALWFKQAGMENGFFLYVSGVMLVAMVVALRLRDSARHSLILED